MSSTTQTQKLGIVDFVKMIYEGHPEYSLLAIKAPIEDVGQALIDLRNGLTKRDKQDWRTMKFKEYRIQSRQLSWKKQIALQPYCSEDEAPEPGVPILQVRDTDWTVVIRSLSYLDSDNVDDVQNEAQALSAQFQTQAITLIEEDTSGAIGYELFGNGELLEKLQHCDGEVHGFESKLRSEQPEIPDWDYEDEEDYDREYDIATEPRVVFINEFFAELGIYLPAVWYGSDNGKPALQVMPSSEGTVIRADWLSLKEEWTTDVEQPDEDDAA
jgi:hypothetical protein